MKSKSLIASLLCTGIAACGGGGGNDTGSTTPPPPPPPVTAKASISLLAGSEGAPGSADGTGAAASFSGARGISADASGNVYVADYFNGTIRKVTPAGTVSTLAGTAGGPVGLGNGRSADGTGPAAIFCGPEGVAADAAGNVFVADDCNEIRKVTPTGVVTTIANNAQLGGASPGALPLLDPQGIAIDTAGNLYLTDSSVVFGAFGGMSFAGAVVDKIAPGPIVTTLAGTPTTTGAADGTSAAATFIDPIGIAVDTQGNSYVADKINCNIRKITPAGVVTTIAGVATHCAVADGIGVNAAFAAPIGIAIDASGNLFVVDAGSTVREITPDGTVTTIAGDATHTGFAIDGQPGTYFQGYGITVIDAHTLAVSTSVNILKITLP
jgi:sugar lactone lactonase YvrE